MTMISKATNIESEMSTSGLNDLKLGAIFCINETKTKILGTLG